MPKYLRSRVEGNTKPNPHASPQGQVWEALEAKLGRAGLGSLMDGMKRAARPRRGR